MSDCRRLVAFGRRNFWKLPLLLLVWSALYTAALFLNDAFDAEFDQSTTAFPADIRPEKIPLENGLAFGWRGWRWGFSPAVFWKNAALLALVLRVCIFNL